MHAIAPNVSFTEALYLNVSYGYNRSTNVNSYLYVCRYGDKYAINPVARVFTCMWILTGLVIQSTFVARVTLSLVSQSLDVDFKLYGSKVSII